MVSVIRPGQRVLQIPGFGVQTSRRAVSVGGAANGLLTGLVAYWKMDEAAGANNALDAHTNGLTLTQSASPGSAAGKIGTARTFDKASSQYFSRASEAALQCGGSSFTIAGWFRWTSIAAATSLVTKDTNTSREYTLDMNAGEARFYINGGAGGYIASSGAGTIAINTWYFIAAWWSAVDQKCRIQLNNGTPAVSVEATTPNSGATEFRVGARQYPGYPDYHAGYIDELGFWKRLLSDDDRTLLYNGGAGLAYSAFS